MGRERCKLEQGGGVEAGWESQLCMLEQGGVGERKSATPRAQR